MRFVGPVLAGLLLLSALSPLAAAHHPGSNHGLSIFGVELPILGQPQNIVHNQMSVDFAFAEWEATWPDRVERYTIGQTSSGFDLYGIRVTDESVPFDAASLSTGHKLRVYLDGGHHGNEYLGVELIMYYLEDLLQQAADGDEETLAFLRDVEIHAVPIINVDGNFFDTRKNSRLVDPNRNYDYEWGGPGSGGSPTDFTYRGPSAFSEAETKANADWATELSPDLWITMHTGIAEFYWPWGWTHDNPPDHEFFVGLKEPFEAATNGRVEAMQAAELYVASGATDDWGYAILGTPTFTYEVHENQFIPVYGQPIPLIVKDQLGGLDFMVKNVRHLGAWIEPVLDGSGWVLENQGWGVATNVSWTLGTESGLVERIEPGERFALPLLSIDDVKLSYPVLLIESSRIRTHSMGAVTTQAGDGGDASGIPGPGLLLVGIAAMVGASLARRRG